METAGLSAPDRLQQAYRSFGGGVGGATPSSRRSRRSSTPMRPRRTTSTASGHSSSALASSAGRTRRSDCGWPTAGSPMATSRGAVEAITDAQRIVAAAETGGIVRLVSSILVVLILGAPRRGSRSVDARRTLLRHDPRAARRRTSPPPPDVLSGETADVYFERARAILAAERLDPVVTMEIFSRGEGVLCGAEEAHRLPARDLRRGERQPRRRWSSRSTTETASGRRRWSCASRRATPPSACTRPPSSASSPSGSGWATRRPAHRRCRGADPGHRLRRAARASQRRRPDGLRLGGRRLHRRLDAGRRAAGRPGSDRHHAARAGPDLR